MTGEKGSGILRRALRLLLWALLGVLALIILAVAALQLPGLQTYLARRAAATLSEKTGTRIEVGSLRIALPGTVVLTDLFVEGAQQDTLLALRGLLVETDLLGLLRKTIRVQALRVDSLTVRVSRSLPDSVFNFAFLLNALASPSPPGAPPDTSSGSPWSLQVRSVSLRGIRAAYDDDLSGLHAVLNLGALELLLYGSDPGKGRYDVESLSLEQAWASLLETRERAPSPDTSGTSPLAVDLGKAALGNLHLRYASTVSGDSAAVDLGTMRLTGASCDLPLRRIALREFLLEGSRFRLFQADTGTIAARPAPAQKGELAWGVTLDRLSLHGNRLQFDAGKGARRRGLDPHHLRVEELALEAGKIKLVGNRIEAAVLHASLREEGGLELRDLSCSASVDDRHARCTNLELETAASRLHQDLRLSFPSRSALTHSPARVTVDSCSLDARLGAADLRYFHVPLAPGARGSLALSVRLSGPVSSLRLASLHLTGGASTELDLSGTAEGLPDVRHARFDITFARISTGRADLHALLDSSLVPGSITVPDSITIAGRFTGTFADFQASAKVATSIGQAEASVGMAGWGSSRVPLWRAEVAASDFDVGALINKHGTVGRVSLHGTADGRGLRKEDLAGRLDAEVEMAELQGYPYRHISLHGNAGPRMFDGSVSVQDSSIAFTFKGTVNTGAEPPAYNFRLDLTGANLRHLHLTTDDIRVSGTLDADLTGRSIEDANGTVDARDIVLMKNGRRYLVDSVVSVLVNKGNETHLSIESPVLAAHFDGTMTLGTLPDALEDHLERYFSLHRELPERPEPPQSFTFQVVLRNPRLLTGVLLPQLRRLVAGRIDGSFNSATRSLTVNAVVPAFLYSDVRIDTLSLHAASNPLRLEATLRAASIADSTLNVTNLVVGATVQHDSIAGTVQSTGTGGDTKLLLAGVLNSVPEGFRFRFNPGGVVFRNQPWEAVPGGYLLFGKGGFLAHDLTLRGAGQSLALSGAEEARSPLKVEFGRFQIGTLLQAVARDTGLVGGVLDGSVTLQQGPGSTAFAADLRIANLSFQGREVGDIALHADNQRPGLYAVAMDVTGQGNEVALHGTAGDAGSGGALDLLLDIKTLNLALFEPLASGAVQRLSGSASGALHVTGTSQSPEVNGSLKFGNAAFSPSFLGSYLRVADADFEFGGKTVEVKSFGLSDTLGQLASLGGWVSTEDFRMFGFDLLAHTDDFLILNRPSDGKAPVAGTVFLTSDMQIQGDQTRPVITVQARLDKGTDLVIVRGEAEAAVQRSRGVVEFVDRKHPGSPIMTAVDTGAASRDTSRSAPASVTLSSNVEVSRDSRLRFVVDPASGDSLVIRGVATVSFGMDPSGKTTLTGRYEIASGSYNLSFGGLVKKNFEIAQGSSITWFGSALDAQVDITAIYTVKASALDLMQSQISTLSQEEQNRYRQQYPVQVSLIMGGKLTAPDIHFRLDLPADQRGALGGAFYAKLNELNSQESELNKQVFALLVLGGFIAENPLASAGNGGGLSGFARSSVSQILSDQLNRLSQQYITGVSLNVGVQSYQDYSSGEAEGRTQLQLGLSTKLFDERMTVQVGGNVDLEGRQSQQNSLNNFAGDIKVSYGITRDGRWQLEVFRQNNYAGLIEGELVETGAGIVFTVDYDKLFGIGLTPLESTTEASK